MDAIRLDEKDLFQEISKIIFHMPEFRDFIHGLMMQLKVITTTV